jgi:hypothetical protein
MLGRLLGTAVGEGATGCAFLSDGGSTSPARTATSATAAMMTAKIRKPPSKRRRLPDMPSLTR